MIYTDQERPQSARGSSHRPYSPWCSLRQYFFFFTVSFRLASLAAWRCAAVKWKSFAAMAASGVVCSLFFEQSFPG